MPSYQFPVRRTPEQGHTKACTVRAMIAALENLRDNADITDFDFRIAAQNNEILREADAYLAEGMTLCICPRIDSDIASEHGQPLVY